MLKKLYLIVGISVLMASSLLAQEPDAYHLKLFEAGEKAFIEGDYKDAAKKLDLALFGMNDELVYEAKAYTYLGISQHYLNNLQKSEQAIRAATQVLDQIGYEQAGLHRSALIDLQKLQVLFHLKDAAGPIANTEFVNISTPQLERDKKNSPHKVALYYELHNRYKNTGKQKDAEKVLEELVKKNPDEIDGYIQLGIYEYKIRKYDDCVKDLGRLFLQTRTTEVAPLTLRTARAYQILAADRDKDKDKTEELAKASASMFTPENIRLLSLEPADKVRLIELIADYQEEL